MASGILLRSLKRERQEEGYPAVGYSRPKANGSAYVPVLVPCSSALFQLLLFLFQFPQPRSPVLP